MNETTMRHPMNLQLFAEPADPPATDPDPADPEGKGGEETKPKAFTQADMDKLAAKIRAEERKRSESEIAKARSEGERLARMSEEEKAQAEREKREADLVKREKEIAARELRATARDILTEKSLPSQLLEVLDYASADSVKSSIETMEKAFRSAVQAGVEQRMRGSSPEIRKGDSAEAQRLADLRHAFGLDKPEKKK